MDIQQNPYNVQSSNLMQFSLQASIKRKTFLSFLCKVEKFSRNKLKVMYVCERVKQLTSHSIYHNSWIFSEFILFYSFSCGPSVWQHKKNGKSERKTFDKNEDENERKKNCYTRTNKLKIVWNDYHDGNAVFYFTFLFIIARIISEKFMKHEMTYSIVSTVALGKKKRNFFVLFHQNIIDFRSKYFCFDVKNRDSERGINKFSEPFSILWQSPVCFTRSKGRSQLPLILKPIKLFWAGASGCSLKL